MLKKFLKEVISIVVGKNAEDIVDLLDTKKHVNEFIISKKLDLTINQTRNILYKISDHGLVSSIRKKDKRKGWYTYFWKIEILKSLEFLKEDLSKKIDQLESQIKSRETKRFYVCENCHIEMTEENALAVNFLCNECGAVFVLKDNTKVLKEMKRGLDRLQDEMKIVEEEIEKESKKIEEAKQRTIKKDEKEKKKEREIKRKLRKAAKDKEAKKSGNAKKSKVKKVKSPAKNKSKKRVVKKKSSSKKSKAKKVVKKKSPAKAKSKNSKSKK